MTGRSIARSTRSGTFVGPGIWRNGRPLTLSPRNLAPHPPTPPPPPREGGGYSPGPRGDWPFSRGADGCAAHWWIGYVERVCVCPSAGGADFGEGGHNLRGEP